ncbi:hypothetical protein MCOR30_011797 [Pyricularia oryzae]|nr:hypothetical protein MCOR30_011797 [Pyricularia oryzae]KAI6531324.1 hypothetical protein MCOR05_007435 [Pyricularia oryzae]
MSDTNPSGRRAQQAQPTIPNIFENPNENELLDRMFKELGIRPNDQQNIDLATLKDATADLSEHPNEATTA